MGPNSRLDSEDWRPDVEYILNSSVYTFLGAKIT